jgi:hypothetical protein
MAPASPRGLAQALLMAAGVALYPYMVAVEGLVVEAPIVSGLLLAAASIVGSRYICPVRWGVLPGAAAIAAIALLEPGHIAWVSSNPLLLALFALYHLATTSAVGGAALLAYWNLSRMAGGRLTGRTASKPRVPG